MYDLDNQIKILSSQTDELDCLVAVASGILCSMLDILWVGDFSIKEGRSFASDKIEKLVTKTAKFRGYKGNDLKEAVKFLEKEYPIPSDGNMPDFGGISRTVETSIEKSQRSKLLNYAALILR